MGKKIISYRPRAFYDRKVALEADLGSLRRAHLRLVDEHEKLRAWVREQGLRPPVFNLPAEKVQDICEQPTTQWQEAVKGRAGD